MTPFYLRKAEWTDARTLLDWANDPDTRRNSFRSDGITWEEHIGWFEACLKNPNIDFYICCCEDQPVGQVRLNCEGEIGVVSYSIAREARGQGIGSQIIQLIEKEALRSRPELTTLSGSVKTENVASQRIFEKNGYRKETVQASEPYLRYIKALTRRPAIGIRVDANSHIATGHMMRCLSIAAAVRKTGADCVFFTAEREAARYAEDRGFECVPLDSQWDDLEPEADRLRSALRERGIGKLLVDTYYATPAYLERLRTGVSAIYMDDLNAFFCPADMLINYNIYSGLFDYPRLYRNTGTRLLLGCDYAPLREEFRGLPPVARDSVRRVLITTGGTDPYNVAGKLLKRIGECGLFGGVEFHVIAGRLNAQLDSLKALSEKRPGFVVYSNAQRMAELMRSCDLAVSAGGSTLYELCACGLPTVTLSMADNQLYAVREFAVQGLMPYAGDMRADESACVGAVLAALTALTEDKERRRQTAQGMRLLVDGNGAGRIADAIAAL